MFKALAPTREMLNANYQPAEFVERILDPLDPQKVWDQLHELAGGGEPVLLCFERPPFSKKNWCHRRLVAAFFEERLGVKVPEIGYDGPDFVGR
jgi:hypothetical protein